MMKGIQKIISGILVFCLLLPMPSMQVVAAEETVASTEEIMDVTHTIAEDAEKTTWTEAEMQDYSGNITWVPYGEEHVHEYDANHKCECGAIGGTCGENLSWTLKDGVLTISGIGMMESYSSSRYQPWYMEKITKVVIKEGVTSIGDYAFHQCDDLMSVTIPDSITSIGSGAFFYCTSLTSIAIPDGVECIDTNTFRRCSSLCSISLPDGL